MPPPPPPAAPPPPPSSSSAPPPSAAPKDLLKSIHKGAKLKKVVTVDKSGPHIEGPKTAPAKTGGGRSPPLPRGGAGTDGPSAPQMGGLFAGGMPKLKSSNNGLAAALRARSSSGGNVNTGTYPPPTPQSAPAAAPRRDLNPVLMPQSRNVGGDSPAPPPVAPRNMTSNNQPLPPPSVPSRPVDQFSSSKPSESNVPSRTSSFNAPPPVVPRSSTVPAKPSSLLNPASSRGGSPRTSITNIHSASTNASGNQMPSSYQSNLPNSSMNNTSNTSLTIQDGRWSFQTDIPIPRQWPSGDPAATTGSSSAAPAKSRPPPPPPSRSVTTGSSSGTGKRPPPPPPGR